MKERIAPGRRWQNEANGGGWMDEVHLQRRVHGAHDVRLDGLADLLSRAQGASVLDVGCNRGHLGYDFALNGARLVHGCDVYAGGIAAARHWFSELPHCQSKFEVVDLTQGPSALNVFGDGGYDIVLFIGVVHKLKRVMPKHQLSALVRHLGGMALTYLAWNGYPEDVPMMDADLNPVGLRRIHTSEFASRPDRPSVAAVWRRT